MISTFGVARENDGGSLRALCQACDESGEKNPRKACVLVTIYRRESDLFALLLRESLDFYAGIGKGGRGRGGASGLTVLCDMTLDDAVHLETQATPLMVKVVNACDPRSYLLEFGRDVDLTTFQRGFVAARGYFRKMLTLRTIVADSFWQGFAAGAGGPVRNEPYRPRQRVLEPPPVGAGQAQYGLRGRTDEPGAGGAEAEDLASEVGLLPQESGSLAGNGGQNGSGSTQTSSARSSYGKTPSKSWGGPRPYRRKSSTALVASATSPDGSNGVASQSPGGGVSDSGGGEGERGDVEGGYGGKSKGAGGVGSEVAAGGVEVDGGRSGKGGSGSSRGKSKHQNEARGSKKSYTISKKQGPCSWPAPKVPVDKSANKRFNMRWLGTGRYCHRCRYGAHLNEPRFLCPRGRPHAFCPRCLLNAFTLDEALLRDGSYLYMCPVCEGFCPCPRCTRSRDDNCDDNDNGETCSTGKSGAGSTSNGTASGGGENAASTGSGCREPGHKKSLASGSKDASSKSGAGSGRPSKDGSRSNAGGRSGSGKGGGGDGQPTGSEKGPEVAGVAGSSKKNDGGPDCAATSAAEDGASASQASRGKTDSSAENVDALIQAMPAPKLTHYEGLFTKYLQSLPSLERFPMTEDVCFLCKEGGNLVECDEGTDWSRRVKAKHAALGKPRPIPGQPYSSCGVPEEVEECGAGAGGNCGEAESSQCKKVYHAYCMGFSLGDDELGSCPRHACLDCGQEAAFFCRFCPVSLCPEHYRTDPSQVIGEKGLSMLSRARNPYRRSRSSSNNNRKRASSSRSPPSPRANRPSRGSRSRFGRSSRPVAKGWLLDACGAPGTEKAGAPADAVDVDKEKEKGSGTSPGDSIALATRRQKRSLAATGSPGAGCDGSASKRSRGASGSGIAASRGSAGGGATSEEKEPALGFEGPEFVCEGCKMAARRAVRQYGLLGSLETGGLVLPYGESDESGNESEDEAGHAPPQRRQEQESLPQTETQTETQTQLRSPSQQQQERQEGQEEHQGHGEHEEQQQEHEQQQHPQQGEQQSEQPHRQQPSPPPSSPSPSPPDGEEQLSWQRNEQQEQHEQRHQQEQPQEEEGQQPKQQQEQPKRPPEDEEKEEEKGREEEKEHQRQPEDQQQQQQKQQKQQQQQCEQQQAPQPHPPHEEAQEAVVAPPESEEVGCVAASASTSRSPEPLDEAAGTPPPCSTSTANETSPCPSDLSAPCRLDPNPLAAHLSGLDGVGGLSAAGFGKTITRNDGPKRKSSKDGDDLGNRAPPFEAASGGILRVPLRLGVAAVAPKASAASAGTASSEAPATPGTTEE